MTQPEELSVIKSLKDKLDKVTAEYEALKAENKCLKVKVGELDDQIDRMSYDREYSNGLIAGLVFSVQCNGVSGCEITPPTITSRPW